MNAIRQHNILILTLVTLLVSLTSCGVSKRATAWHTWKSDKTETTLIVDSNKYTLNAQIQAVNGTMVVFSIKPVLGVEVYRIEFGAKNITIIDRIHKTYTVTSYATLNTIIKPQMNLKSLQKWLLKQDGKKYIPLTYKALGHTATIAITSKNIQLDAATNIKTPKLENYTYLPVMDFLKQYQ